MEGTGNRLLRDIAIDTIRVTLDVTLWKDSSRLPEGLGWSLGDGWVDLSIYIQEMQQKGGEGGCEVTNGVEMGSHS